MTAERWAERLWAKDGSLWMAAPDEAPNWLGWLDVVDTMSRRMDVFQRARESVGSDRFDHCVLAGMGGSSLCPEVLTSTFGPQPGWPELIVLDSTDPSTIAAVESRLNLARTMFIISSKSGGTLETLSHYRYFHERLRQAGVAQHGRHFIAITDARSGLEKLAHENGFAAVFDNPADIGGRYSALSYFGLMPACVMGLDVTALLDRAQAMAGRCREPDAAINPGLLLGAFLGTAAIEGRDKATLICSPRIATFGLWLEQLLAESTGKDGRGIIPVADEPLGEPQLYGDDRIFIYLRTPIGCADQDPFVDALRAAGQPVLTLEIDAPMALAGEFMRWEVATAVAGALIEINPFDQPNVQESKDNTKAALERFVRSGDFGVDLGGGDPHDELTRLQQSARPGDYFAVLAYTQPSPQVDAALEEVRMRERELLRIATTAGYGPRYLHSTGQLHKGGPNTGIFLILSDNRDLDIPIPEEPYGFRTLMRAQWVGDLQSLRNHGRRVAHLDLGPEPAAGLERVLEVMRQPV
jgi:glucose-6-phosphate isomerase